MPPSVPSAPVKKPRDIYHQSTSPPSCDCASKPPFNPCDLCFGWKMQQSQRKANDCPLMPYAMDGGYYKPYPGPSSPPEEATDVKTVPFPFDKSIPRRLSSEAFGVSTSRVEQEANDTYVVNSLDIFIDVETYLDKPITRSLEQKEENGPKIVPTAAIPGFLETERQLLSRMSLEGPFAWEQRVVNEPTKVVPFAGIPGLTNEERQLLRDAKE